MYLIHQPALILVRNLNFLNSSPLILMVFSQIAQLTQQRQVAEVTDYIDTEWTRILTYENTLSCFSRVVFLWTCKGMLLLLMCYVS